MEVYVHVPLFPVAERQDLNGSGLLRYIRCSYWELYDAFGEPHFGPSADGKIQAEWAFRVGGEHSDLILTIYDYKEDAPKFEVEGWHIGGRHLDPVMAVEIVNHAIGLSA